MSDPNFNELAAHYQQAEAAEATETRQAGRRLGFSTVAEKTLRTKMLRRLHEWSQRVVRIHENLARFHHNPQHTGGIGRQLYGIMHLEDESDRGEVASFWEDVLGEHGLVRIDDIDFAAGWVEGVLETWAQVEAAMKNVGS
jgi:hypothetical protein